MIITICSSIKFFDRILRIKDKLEELGHVVLMPVKVEGVDYLSKDGTSRVEAKKRFGFISKHMEKIEQSDAILVANFTKDGIENYIGANTFMEMGFAHYRGKIIFLLNPISDQKYIIDEVLTMEPIVLDRNLYRIPKAKNTSICDHTSVGILVWKEGELLLIERMRKPIGFAPPAGHVDSNPSFEEAAHSELWEEVELIATGLRFLAEGRKENPCRRWDGTWHYWKIYEAMVENYNVKASPDETKQYMWCSKDKLKELAQRTEEYLAKKITDNEWQSKPGLEPVWKEWLTEIGIL
ncbi:MAG: NUDIX hydrolase [Patescibacteria group bacterium]